jgi:hypothetical protein
VAEKLATAIVDRDLDAALRVLAERGVGARQHAPEGNVQWVALRDLDHPELIGGWLGGLARLAARGAAGLGPVAGRLASGEGEHQHDKDGAPSHVLLHRVLFLHWCARASAQTRGTASKVRGIIAATVFGAQDVSVVSSFVGRPAVRSFPTRSREA